MNISFREDGNEVAFVVADYLPAHTTALEASYYSFEEGSYVKRFSKDSHNLEDAKGAFARHAEEMFSQIAGLRPVPWEDALLAFIEKIQGTGIDWWLTGSCATCLRGIDLRPHDLDIMLRSKDIDKLNQVFRGHIVEPIRSSQGWVVDYFGVLFLNARIDLAFDPQPFVDDPEPADFGPYAMDHLEEVLWRDHTVRVPPLDLQLRVNQRRGRSDRVRAIRDHLAGRSNTDQDGVQ